MHHQVQIEARPQDVGAEESGRVGLGHGGLQSAQHGDDLTADVDERMARPNGVGRDDRALDEDVRRGHHERNVLAGAWFRLVCVDHQVVRLGAGALGALRDERPLLAGGEARAATTAQSGVLHQPDHGVRLHRERLAEALITVVAPIGLDGPGGRFVPVAAQHRCQGHSRTPFLGGRSADGAGAGSSRAVSSAISSSSGPAAVGWDSAGLGAVMARSLAIRNPARVASPAVTPSLAPGRGSGKPARIRAVWRKEQGEVPRVAVTGVAAAQVVDEIPCRRRRLVVEELPVHHDHRGVVAGGVAFDVLEGHLPIGSGLPGVDVQVLFENFEDRITAHHRTQRVGAHADQVFAGGRPAVHRVEGGHRRHLGGTEAQLPCTEGDSRGRQITVLGLHQVQQGKQGRPRPPGSER